VAHAVTAFLEERQPHWGVRTLGIHLNSWRHLEPLFGKLLLEDVRPEHISRYQRERRKANLSTRTINIEISLLRMLMVKHRLWHNIAPDVRMLREREDVGRALSPDEEHRLLAAAKRSASRSLHAAIQLSLHTGMRNQELRLLRWRQVDLLKGEVRVGKSKTAAGEGRIIPLSGAANGCMQEWRSIFPDAKPDHFVFPSERYGLVGSKGTFGGSVKAYTFDPEKPIASWKSSWTTCRDVAAVSCRWHDMRHTFISRMGENMVADQTLLALAGQLSRKMLERYSHVRNESKRAAIKSLDGGTRVQDSPQIPPQPDEAESFTMQ
jgi:integrase